RDRTRPFAGLDYATTSRLTLAADTLFKSGAAQRQTSLVARYDASSRCGAQIGIAKLGGDRKLFAGLVFRFSKNASR
ncbi:MAG TPA: hypothetical protein VF719_10890, partial [Abditibacteriaceae bacterium]